MEARQKYPKPGHSPTSGIALSDPSNNLAQETDNIVNVDQLSEPRSHHAASARSASEPPAPRIRPQSRVSDKAQVTTAQSLDACTAWALARNTENQHQSPTETLGHSRGVSPEEESRIIRQARTSFDELVSLVKKGVPQSAEGSNASEIAALQELLGKEQQNNQILAGDLRNVTKEQKKLFRAYQKQSDELHETNARLGDVLLERDQLRRLLEGGTFANSGKTTDIAILGIWKKLAFNIRGLAYTLAQTPDTVELEETVTERLRRVTSDYMRLLHDQDYSHALIQGYLWWLIEDLVFKPIEFDGLTWGGSHTTSFKLLKDKVYSQILSKKGKKSDYSTTLAHAARSFSQVSAMLSKLWDDNNGFIKQIVWRETRFLQPFFSRGSTRASRNEKKISEQLNEIVQDAIELDKMIMCSKAFFMIEWSMPGKKSSANIRYDKTFMEADIHEVELDSKNRVKFFKSPILLKAGTADGQKYDVTNVLAKASVVCN
ncbi:hypothetical protein FAGAP_12289 [Fusarium agapanthi]|uniref:Uncharacterized protein n=1 Tax=Fusarium agapanthi TaxID=1803897 RepID=A0A9P5B414_9HYPO|nr:hypothetical protein FAGAP_12289 [Fusarium agapanthi]